MTFLIFWVFDFLIFHLGFYIFIFWFFIIWCFDFLIFWLFDLLIFIFLYFFIFLYRGHSNINNTVYRGFRNQQKIQTVHLADLESTNIIPPPINEDLSSNNITENTFKNFCIYVLFLITFMVLSKIYIYFYNQFGKKWKKKSVRISERRKFSSIKRLFVYSHNNILHSRSFVFLISYIFAWKFRQWKLLVNFACPKKYIVYSI